MSYYDLLPPVQSLAVFEVAARHQSFTRAATELNSTQPAVSQNVKALEAHLGVQLFRRIYRGVELTEAGQKLFDAVHSAFETMEKTIHQLQKHKIRQRINVATDFALAAYWLMPRLPGFRKIYPDADIRIMTAQANFDFYCHEIDVAIILGDGDYNNHNNRKTFMLFPEEVFPVCSPAFLEKHGPVTSVGDLAALPMLKLELDSSLQWMRWDSFFSALDSQISPGKPVMAFNNYTLLIQATIAGQGLALGWGTLIDDLLDNRLLVSLPQYTVTSDLSYFLIVLDPEPSEIVVNFVEWLLRPV